MLHLSRRVAIGTALLAFVALAVMPFGGALTSPALAQGQETTPHTGQPDNKEAEDAKVWYHFPGITQNFTNGVGWVYVDRTGSDKTASDKIQILDEVRNAPAGTNCRIRFDSTSGQITRARRTP